MELSALELLLRNRRRSSNARPLGERCSGEGAGMNPVGAEPSNQRLRAQCYEFFMLTGSSITASSRSSVVA